MSGGCRRPDFFTGFPSRPTLEPDELLVEIRVPQTGAAGWAYEKFTRPANDWAIVGVAVARVDGASAWSTWARRRCAPAAEQALAGGASIADAAARAAEGTEPPTDVSGSAEYRAHLAQVSRARPSSSSDALSGLTVAVLGLGEAGSRLASDLTAAGAEVRGYDPLGGGAPADAVAGSDVVLSVNSARDAVEAAEGARGTLGQKALYADLNTTAPALKREVAELVGERRFADVALLGAGAGRGLNTPALASGGPRRRSLRHSAARHAGRRRLRARRRRSDAQAPPLRLHEGPRRLRDRERPRPQRPSATPSG